MTRSIRMMEINVAGVNNQLKPKTEKQMNAQLKSTLVDTMQKWLNDNADDIGSNLSIWQDTKPTGQNAHLMATAAETVLDAMALQSRLEDELGA